MRTNQPFTIPLHNRFLRVILRPFFRGLFHILSRVHVYGLENVPKSGPYVIAINHISLFEPPFVMAFWPVAPEAAGAVEIWSKPGQSILVRLYGAIPVHRGEYDRRLIESMIAALKAGHPLLIAPEGGRTHSPGLRRAFPGAAYVIDQVKVPVVPVGIVGSTDDFLAKALRVKRPIIEMRIGEAIRLSPIEGVGKIRQRARQRNVDIIMRHIATLMPPEYRGEYSSGYGIDGESN